MVKNALNISAVLICTVRCSSSEGSSSSFGDVCVAVTTATRKDESQNRKTKSKPLAEVWMGSEVVKPGMGFKGNDCSVSKKQGRITRTIA